MYRYIVTQKVVLYSDSLILHALIIVIPYFFNRRPGEDSDSDSSRMTSSDDRYEAGSVGHGSQAQVNNVVLLPRALISLGSELILLW